MKEKKIAILVFEGFTKDELQKLEKFGYKLAEEVFPGTLIIVTNKPVHSISKADLLKICEQVKEADA